MRELKVGEYIRTKNGDIEKILDINKYDREDIKKNNFDIVYIIEEGDYVNGFKVDEVVNDIIVYCDNWRKEFYEHQIKSVVTHEQFEQISYKIKEIENV